MENTYKDRDWLYEQYVNQRRTLADIAEEFGVTHKAVGYYKKKYGIPEPINEDEIEVKILCNRCRTPFKKKMKYLKRRLRDGVYKFYCSRECADKAHSERMTGEGNPNYNGKWHGPDPSTIFTKEERSAKAKRQMKQAKESGEMREIVLRLSKGHKRFFSTPEGELLRRKNGVKSTLAQASKRETTIEKAVREFLESENIDFETQKPMYYWVVDFYIPSVNLVIEVNGDYWHGNPAIFNELNATQKRNIARDKAKANYLTKCGHDILVLWENEIKNDFERCIEKIREKLIS